MTQYFMGTEAAGSTKLVEFISNYVPWFSAALACFASGGGFYDPQFPQLIDGNENIISNYLYVEYQCSEFTLDRFEITQSNDEVSQIVFWIDTNRIVVESLFFVDEPDIILDYGYSISSENDSNQHTAHTWLSQDYALTLKDSIDLCQVSINKRVSK